MVARRKLPGHLPSKVCQTPSFIWTAYLSTDFSLPAPLLVAPPSNELTICRLLYRTLPVERNPQRNSRTSPGVDPLLIVETVLDDNVTTESGPFEIILNPAPGNNTICRHGYETSVDLILPDRWVQWRHRWRHVLMVYRAMDIRLTCQALKDIEEDEEPAEISSYLDGLVK